MRRFAIAVALVSLAAPAWASKETERLQIQVAALQGQISELQRSSEEMTRELRRLNELLADHGLTLKKFLQEQKASDETLQTTLRELGERVGELESHLQQVQTLGATGAPPAGPPTEPGAPQAPGATPGAAPPGGAAPAPPKELYSQAYADFARGNYDLAIQGFQEYLRAYPQTDFSDNAQYWIGESLYGKQKWNEAVEAWNALLRDFASSDKLPDARVKKGMALEKLGRRSQALLEYRFVVDHYPNSPAARVARERLNPR